MINPRKLAEWCARGRKVTAKKSNIEHSWLRYSRVQYNKESPSDLAIQVPQQEHSNSSIVNKDSSMEWKPPCPADKALQKKLSTSSIVTKDSWKETHHILRIKRPRERIQTAVWLYPTIPESTCPCSLPFRRLKTCCPRPMRATSLQPMC